MDNINPSYLLLAALIAGVVIWIVIYIKKSEEEEKLWKVFWRTLSADHDFWWTQKVIGADGQTALAVDTNRADKTRVCLITRTPGMPPKQYLPAAPKVLLIYPSDLLSVEIFEDGSSVTQTSRSSQAAGAVLGGLVFGAAGAVIGGLSGKTATSAGPVKRLDLRLIINDHKRPVFDINFLDREEERNSEAYKAAIEKVRHWNGVMKVLIHQADAAS